MSLCEPCTKEWMGWLDYKLPPAPIALIQPGGNSLKAVEARRSLRIADWRNTIITQQTLIKNACERTHQ